MQSKSPQRLLRSLRPLASYVLRVRGQPASLRFELHDLRNGERHLFRRGDSVLAFLLRHAIPADEPGDAGADPR